ncbi:MAG: alpha/beta hydrolase [Fuerstiella sp.]|nr:alpha/beta hydrolase [Fuerstiella sp.]MCP4786022.1 alpha/beta hydrolase [Fuerstiella sp.]MCP4857233.1 alpha/beta hydrolase [Fuerstiella sp.]
MTTLFLPLRASLLLLLAVPGLAGAATAADWFQEKSDWHGFERLHFTVAQRAAYVVVPKEAAVGKPWVWRARFPDYHFEMDVELLNHGFHIAYVDVGGMFGNSRAMNIGDEFYSFMTKERNLAARPVLEGVSRGGLFVYNWTARRPDNVACIYCDTPVLDFKSWPAGKGKGIGSAGAWKQCLAAYALNQEQALKFSGNPLDHAAVIAKNEIPVLHIVSENDVVVPPAENTYLLQARLKELGYDMPVISVPLGTEKSHGHHFTHPEHDRVVKFIRRHAN